MSINISTKKLDKPTRLDRFLRTRFPEWGRQAVNQIIGQRQVKINGRTVWLNSWKVKNGDKITVLQVPDALPQAPTRFDETWIIHHDGDMIAINKPVGLLSQETKWRKDGNLLTLARERFGKVTLFHRLDRDTSGVILLTRGGKINQHLDQCFKNQTIEKEYLAIVHKPNQLDPSGSITAALDKHSQRRDMMMIVSKGGQSAQTDYKIETENESFQLIRLWLRTGRSHQIRVHLQSMNAPIIGDRLYGKKDEDSSRLMLHAHRITIPAYEDKPERQFEAPIPEEFSVYFR
jgi:23S rRNA pseudouridine1911/1915/1917 synthase